MFRKNGVVEGANPLNPILHTITRAKNFSGSYQALESNPNPGPTITCRGPDY